LSQGEEPILILQVNAVYAVIPNGKPP